VVGLIAINRRPLPGRGEPEFYFTNNPPGINGDFIFTNQARSVRFTNRQIQQESEVFSITACSRPVRPAPSELPVYRNAMTRNLPGSVGASWIKPGYSDGVHLRGGGSYCYKQEALTGPKRTRDFISQTDLSMELWRLVLTKKAESMRTGDLFS
jgi:hypothetical protein